MGSPSPPRRAGFFVYTGPLRADPPGIPRGLDPGDGTVFVSGAASGARPTGGRDSPYESLGQAFAALRARRDLAPAQIVLLGDAPHRLPPRVADGLPPAEICGQAAIVGEGVVQSSSRDGGLLTVRAARGGVWPEPGDLVHFPKTHASALVGEATSEGGAFALQLALPPGADCAPGDPFLVKRTRSAVLLAGPVELGPTAWKNVDFVVPEGAAASLRLTAKTGFTQCRFTVGPGAGLLVEGGTVVAGHPPHGWADPSAGPARAGVYVSAREGTFVRRAAVWAPDRLSGCVFDGAARLYGAYEISAAYFRGAGHQLVFGGGASEVADTHFRCDPGPGRPLLQADSGAFLRIRSVDIELPAPAARERAGSVALFATQRATVEASGLRVRGAETALMARAATVRTSASALVGGLGEGAVATGGSTLDLATTLVEGSRGRGISAADSTLILADSTVRDNGSDGIDAVNCRVALTSASGAPGAGHVAGNRGAGIRVRAGSTGRLEGLHVTENADAGLVVDGASSLVWSRCVVAGNSGGVRVAGCSSLSAESPYTVSGNNASGADEGVGVSVRGASSCCLGPGRVDGHCRTQAEATPQSLVENESEGQ